MARSLETETETAPPRSSGSAARTMALAAFLGFGLLAAILAYARHDAIAAAAPQVAEPLAAYVAWVDSMRERLTGLLGETGL